MTSHSVESLFAKYGSRYRWFALVAAMLASTMTFFATHMIYVAIPAMMEVFKMSQDTAQWLSTGFLAATAGTMLMTPWCVSRFGQRHTYLITLSIFVAASLVGGLATNTPLLIFSRIVQGAMGGIITPLAMITIFTVFPADRRGFAMGMYGLGTTLAPVAGPTVGGLLVDHIGWSAVFFFTIPLCIPALLIAPFFIPGRDEAADHHDFDWGGFALSSAFLLCLLYGFYAINKHGLSAGITVASLVLAAATGIAFCYWELHRRHPMLELRIFSNAQFRAATLVSIAWGIAIFGSNYLAPLLVQTVFGYSASRAGLLIAPSGIALACMLPFAGRLTDRMSAHYLVTAGLLLFSVSAYLFATANSLTGFWEFAFWLVIGRTGLGIIIPSNNIGAFRSLDARFISQGSSAINFSRQVAGAFGVNMLSTLLEWRAGVYALAPGVHGVALDALAPRIAAFRDCFILIGSICLLALIPGWRMKDKETL